MYWGKEKREKFAVSYHLTKLPHNNLESLATFNSTLGLKETAMMIAMRFENASMLVCTPTRKIMANIGCEQLNRKSNHDLQK